MTPDNPLPFDIGFSRSPAGRRRDPDAPFRILICGDFSGTSALRPADLAQRKPLRVDVDSLERVFARLAPRVTLSIRGAENPLDIPTLDDFHPDSLVRRVPLFGALRSLRAELADPSRFERAAAALGASSAGAPPAASAPATPPASDAASDIERLLGRKPQAAAPASGAGSFVQGLIRDIVAPHIRPGADSRQQALTASVDGALAQLLRQVLHDPGFRRLEAAWRSVERLVSEVGGEEQIEIHLLDITKTELFADIRAHAQALGESATGRLLLGAHAGSGDSKGWAVVALDDMLDASPADIALLAALGSLVAGAGAALLAGIDGGILGSPDGASLGNPPAWRTPDPQITAHWQSVRRLPCAPAIGAIAGRIMLRRPYGAKSDPIEAFTFDEITDPSDTGGFLWGSPAPMAAMLAALAYRDDSWDLNLDAQREITDLPAFSYRDRDGDVQMRTSTESLLSEHVAARWVDAGIMPLMGRRDRHSAQLVRWQSLADPVQALRGPWG